MRGILTLVYDFLGLLFAMFVMLFCSVQTISSNPDVSF